MPASFVRDRTLPYLDWLEVAQARDPNWSEYRLQRSWRRWEAKVEDVGAVQGGQEVAELGREVQAGCQEAVRPAVPYGGRLNKVILLKKFYLHLSKSPFSSDYNI